MAERSYPRAWTRLLPEESARWVEQGLISGEQRDRILKLYPAPEEAGRERVVLIFSLLGSLLVGAGVVLFFAANWPRLPALVKVGAIMAAVLGAYGSGYFLWFVRGTHPRVGHSLVFLGGLLYGAGIWLIARLFHMEGSWPDGLLLWALGVLPVAWAVGSLPVLLLGAGVLTAWGLAQQTLWGGYNYLYPVLLLGGVWPLSRRLRTALGEAAVLVGLFLWFAIAVGMHELGSVGGYEPLVMFRLLLLYGVAVLLGGLAQVGAESAWLGTGGLMTLGAAYALTFQLTADPSGLMPPPFFGSPFVMAGTGLLWAAMVPFIVRYWRQGGPERWLALPVPVLLAGAAGALHLMGDVVRMVLFNLLLFAGTAGLVALGVRRQNELLVNMGLGAFLIHLLTRYADLFFPAMNRAVFFILGGALLLAVGWLLERNRRRWVGDWSDAGKEERQ